MMMTYSNDGGIIVSEPYPTYHYSVDPDHLEIVVCAYRERIDVQQNPSTNCGGSGVYVPLQTPPIIEMVDKNGVCDVAYREIICRKRYLKLSLFMSMCTQSQTTHHHQSVLKVLLHKLMHPQGTSLDLYNHITSDWPYLKILRLKVTNQNRMNCHFRLQVSQVSSSVA